MVPDRQLHGYHIPMVGHGYGYHGVWVGVCCLIPQPISIPPRWVRVGGIYPCGGVWGMGTYPHGHGYILHVGTGGYEKNTILLYYYTYITLLLGVARTSLSLLLC